MGAEVMVHNEITVQVLTVVGVFLAAYIALIRPQLKRIADNQRLLSSLNVGDRVVTGGGFIGKILKFDGPRIVEVELSDKTRVQALRSSIEARLE